MAPGQPDKTSLSSAVASTTDRTVPASLSRSLNSSKCLYATDYKSPYRIRSPAVSRDKRPEHPSPAFVVKGAKEAEKVRVHTERQLHRQMTELFENELFSDLVIVCEPLVKKCHNCLLLTRVPNLYKELYENFRYKDVTSKYSRSAEIVCVRFPPIVEPGKLVEFLRKVYFDNDIRKEEVDLIRKLKSWTKSSERGNMNNSSNKNSGPAIVVTGGGTFSDVSEIDDINVTLNSEEQVPSTSHENNVQATEGLAISLSLTSESLGKNHELNCLNIGEDCSRSVANSESLTNVSESGKEDDSSRGEISSFLSDEDGSDCNDEEGDDEDGDDERKAQHQQRTNSTSSSGMVRSNTFDMLCQASLDKSLDLVTEDDEETTAMAKRKDAMSLNVTRPSSSPKKIPEGPKREASAENSSSAELDAETPIGEQPQRVPSSPGALFQFFVDMDNVQKNDMDRGMTRSGTGFMFIDINKLDEPKDMNRAKQCLNGRGKNERSNSAIVFNCTDRKGSIVRGRSEVRATTASATVDRKDVVKYPSCQNLSGSLTLPRNGQKSLKPDNTAPATLPMSPLLPRKATEASNCSNNPKTIKAPKSLHIRHVVQQQSRMIKSAELPGNNELVVSMSHSWKSDATSELSIRRSEAATPSSNFSNCEDDSETVYSEVSSVGSSFLRKRRPSSRASRGGPSDHELNESLINRTIESCSKLGEDMLKMFMEEVAADVAINVEGRDIRAHKCILVTRSPYFAAMFNGSWAEKEAATIQLQGFSFASVHFALCHLYSGAVAIPKNDINLGELALLADLLALDSLRATVLYELKMNFCHFFHKPCTECSIGVLDCLILSSQCNLKDLESKCLDWIGQNFARLWPTKAFATLQPSFLLEKCYLATLNQITPDNLVDTVISCEKLANSTPRVKWAEPVFGLIAKLMEDTCTYVAVNYDLIVSSSSFIALGRGRSWNISTLEETFLAAMNDLKPDVACRTMVQFTNLMLLSESDTGFGYGPYSDTFRSLIRKMYRHCERYLVQNAKICVACKSWSAMSPETQRHIRDSAVIVFEFEKALAPKPKLSSASKKFTRSRTGSDSTPNDDDVTTMSRKPLPPTPSQSKPISIPRPKTSRHFRPPPVSVDCEPIYDEVPREFFSAHDYGRRPQLRVHSQVSNQVSHLPQTPPPSVARKSQIAKVHPFTFKSSSSTACGGQSVGDLVAAIDAESNIVNHCLQEAELLEQALTRKLKKQHMKGANGGNGHRTQMARSAPQRSIRTAFARPPCQDGASSNGSRTTSASGRRAATSTSSSKPSSRPPFK